MAPTLIPEDPSFPTESERAVWDELRRSLPDDATLIPNFRLTTHERDHEVDLVVVLPAFGVFALEVKGAGLVLREGTWTMRRGTGAEVIDPVAQAQEATHALRALIEHHRDWTSSSRGRVRVLPGVVTPFTDLGGAAPPGCRPWMLHDKTQVPTLVERLQSVPASYQTDRRPPSKADCDAVVDILTGRGMSSASSIEDSADERESRADRLTQEQSMLLGVTRLLRRVEVRGGAGSGKTVLALTQSRELTRGKYGRPRERVGLLCYSIGLASFFKREVASWHYKDRPAFVGTFEELANAWGIESGSRDDPTFWEERLPVLMTEKAHELPRKDRFDSFVVDEAQDFATSWWGPLLGALRDQEQGGLYVYSDENQSLFPRFGRLPVPLVLDHNLRNTKQIAEVFKPLTPMKMRLDGGDGPEVVHVQCSPAEALDVADDQVEALLDEGWSPGNVALLTTGQRHPEQRSRQETDGQDGYWASYWDDDLAFYGHVLGFKGLERRAVVLCVNEDGTRDRFRERIYVGLSRATDRLIVVGDRDVIGRAHPDLLTTLG